MTEQRPCLGCGLPAIREDGGEWRHKEGPLIMAYYPKHEVTVEETAMSDHLPNCLETTDPDQWFCICPQLLATANQAERSLRFKLSADTWAEERAFAYEQGFKEGEVHVVNEIVKLINTDCTCKVCITLNQILLVVKDDTID
jgi:hypothetical protein